MKRLYSDLGNLSMGFGAHRKIQYRNDIGLTQQRAREGDQDL